MEELPEDVLRNIFIRLAAKQLVRMRCVCKPWNVFLSTESSYLIKSHLNHSINKHNEIVLALNLSKPSSHAFPCTAYDSLSGSKLNDLVKSPRNFPQPALNKYGGCVIGSVNGLICFFIGNYERVKGIYIWNASLSAVMSLPPFSEPLFSNIHYYLFSFGFGFDPRTGDYKVVRFIRNVYKSIWPRVEVYSMKKGSWQFIVDSFPSDVDDVFSCLDDHDGHLHWLCNKVNGIKTIVAFDLGVESFSQIPLPDSVANVDQDAGRYNKLSILDGKLCVVSSSRHDNKFEMWVMNEYGVSESWVKSNVLSKLKLKASARFISPFGFTLNNKFLYYEYSKSRLLAIYDQETEKVTYFRNDDPCSPTEFIQYVDSLVWYGQHLPSVCRLD